METTDSRPTLLSAPARTASARPDPTAGSAFPEPPRTSADPRVHLERARELVATDEGLARIEYGRALRFATPTDRVWAEAANDVGVLHFQQNRADLAHGFLAAAHRSFPAEELYLANLEAAGAPQAPARPAVAVKDEGGVASVGHWVLSCLSHAQELASFRRKRVLEIGGALPADVVRQLDVETWTSVDPQAPALDEPSHRVLAASAANLPLPDDSIDLAFSCCAFEHIHELEDVLRETERVLRPGGLLFTEFSPIWSSAHGHHTWVLADDGRTPELTFVDAVLPAWAHLLWGEPELAAYLEPTHGAEIARKAAAAAYRGTYINRLFEDDYYRIFSESRLAVQRLEPIGASPRPTERLQAELEAAHPGRTNFRAAGFRYLAVKRPVRSEPA